MPTPRPPVSFPWYAAAQLALVTGRRLCRSRQTVINLLLLIFAGLVCVAVSLRGERPPAEFLNEVLLPVYLAFLLPVYCLCYTTAGIGGEREEQTLVYLLATPLPRPWIFAAKYAASLALTLPWTLGGLGLMGWLAGSAGSAVVARIWPAAALATLAYVGLFSLFGVVFRRATIVAAGYAFFLEVFLGNMPGIIKRVAITFYAQCLMFDAAAPLGVAASGPHNAALFQPLSAPLAAAVLATAAALLPLAAAWLFSRWEYA